MAGIGILGVTGLTRTALIAASEVPFRLYPSHFNTWKMSVDSIALSIGGQDLCCMSMLTLSQRLMTVDRVCGHGTGQGRSTTLALNNKLWYSRQLYMLLGINNREYSKGIQVYKQLSH
jgi:hypothetical protein